MTFLALLLSIDLSGSLTLGPWWLAWGWDRHGVNVYCERGPWVEDRSPPWDVTAGSKFLAASRPQF